MGSRPRFDSWVGKICWRRDRLPTPVFLGFPCGSAGKESTCSAGDLGSIPGLGRSLEEGKGYPFNYLTSIIRIIKHLSDSFFVSFQQLESSHLACFQGPVQRRTDRVFQPRSPAGPQLESCCLSCQFGQIPGGEYVFNLLIVIPSFFACVNPVPHSR